MQTGVCLRRRVLSKSHSCRLAFDKTKTKRPDVKHRPAVLPVLSSPEPQDVCGLFDRLSEESDPRQQSKQSLCLNCRSYAMGFFTPSQFINTCSGSFDESLAHSFPIGKTSLLNHRNPISTCFEIEGGSLPVGTHPLLSANTENGGKDVVFPKRCRRQV